MMYYAKPNNPALRLGHPLAQNLVGFYSPNSEGEEERDLGLAGLTAQVDTGVSYVNGAYGRAFHFDGTSTGVIEVPTASAEAYQANTWSLTCRFRPQNLTGYGYLVTADSSNALWLLSTNGAEFLYIFRDSTGSLGLGLSSGISLKVDQWYTATISVDAFRVMRLYLDGRLLDEKIHPGTGGFSPQTTTRIGQWTPTSGQFQGDMDYVAIHSRALSGAEVASLHAAPYAMMRNNAFSAWKGLSSCVSGGPGGVSLTQSPEAAFPDRGTVGLKVTLEAEGDGRYLARDLGISHSLIHARAMFNPATVGGGTVTLMRGEDASSVEAFDLKYDPATRGLTLTLGTGATLTGALPAGLAWHCLELKIDAVAGEASLWLNGVEVDTHTGALSSLSVQHAWLGAPYKQSTATGDLYLDDWKLGDEYLGPVVVEPSGKYGNDPARWLVIYNTSNADSVAWAEWYRAARGVPYANLLGLALSNDEEISYVDFTALRQSVSDYLSLNDLDDQILGILCGHGVPGTYLDTLNRSESIAGQLHRIDAWTTQAINGLARNVDDASLERPEALNLSGNRMTARIDGVDLAASRLPTERALAFEAIGFDGSDASEGADAQIWLDPYGPVGVTYDTHRDLILTWSSAAAGGLTRLARKLPTAPVASEDTSHDTIELDGFYWGWGEASPGVDFFGAQAGRRFVCSLMWYEDATSGSLRGGGNGWAQVVLDAGYAAVGVSSRARSASAIPQAAGFFGALRRGWSLGEAWLIANPELRTGMVLVGDPLARVALPRRGWNVYGPLASWAEAEMSGDPQMAMGADINTVTLNADSQPEDGEVGLYVVRGVDALGREESGTRHVRFERAGEAALALAWTPAWPNAPGWTAKREGAGLRFSAAWGGCFNTLGVVRVDLIEEIQGENEQAAATESVAGRATRVSWFHEPGGARARYRFAVVHQSGGVSYSPWSAWMNSATVTPINLEQVS